jgi:hypothetical protein
MAKVQKPSDSECYTPSSEPFRFHFRQVSLGSCFAVLLAVSWDDMVIGAFFQYKKKTPWSESANELYRPRNRRLSAKWLPTFADREVTRGQREGSLRTYSLFSRQEPLLFYQVAPQLYKRGWVHPVPDLLLFFSGSAGNRSRAFGSVAKNSDL